MYKSINGLIKCEKEANENFKQFDPFAEYYSNSSNSVAKNADIKEYQKDYYSNNKSYTVAKETDEPFFKQFGNDKKTFKILPGEESWLDSAKMKYDRKRLPEYYLYNFDKNGLFDIAFKQMDAEAGLTNDLTKALGTEDEFWRLWAEQELQNDKGSIEGAIDELGREQYRMRKASNPKISTKDNIEQSKNNRDQNRIQVEAVMQDNIINTHKEGIKNMPLREEKALIETINNDLNRRSNNELNKNTPPKDIIARINILCRKYGLQPLAMQTKELGLKNKVKEILQKQDPNYFKKLNFSKKMEVKNASRTIQNALNKKLAKSQSRSGGVGESKSSSSAAGGGGIRDIDPNDPDEYSKPSHRVTRSETRNALPIPPPAVSEDQRKRIQIHLASPPATPSKSGTTDTDTGTGTGTKTRTGIKWTGFEKDEDRIHEVQTISKLQHLTSKEVNLMLESFIFGLSKTGSDWQTIAKDVFDDIKAKTGKPFTNKTEALKYIKDLHKVKLDDDDDDDESIPENLGKPSRGDGSVGKEERILGTLTGSMAGLSI